MGARSRATERSVVDGLVPSAVLVKHLEYSVRLKTHPLACKQDTHTRSTTVVSKIKSLGKRKESIKHIYGAVHVPHLLPGVRHASQQFIETLCITAKLFRVVKS